MKRLSALAAACFVALSLLVAPTSAVPPIPECTGSQGGVPEEDCTQDATVSGRDVIEERSIHGRDCITHSRSNAQGMNRQFRTICIAINRKDFPVPTEWNVEGLLSWDHNPADVDHVRIYIDWIRLIRVQDGAVVKFKNNQGWFNVPNEPAPDAYGTSHDSWYAMCTGGWEVGKAYAKARYKLQWMGLSGDPVGDWKIEQSKQLNLDC
jgi:hypothetical protein